MTFPVNAYVLAFLGALLGTSLSLPLWRSWCAAQGHVDAPGHRKIHQRPIPLAGGLALLTGMALPLGLAALALASGWFAHAHGFPSSSRFHLLDSAATELFAYGLERRAPQLIAIGLGALGMVALGWFDDRHELKPGPKFAGQFLIALLVAGSGIRITLFMSQPLVSYVLTILWILTVTNACNFMDNMNGLCTGLGFVGAWCFAWNGALQGQFLVAAVGFLACGALLGFFPFNFPRASTFLGDAGSHLVGYTLALLAILPNFYSPQTPARLAVLKPLLILAVILGDLGWVVFLRWRIGPPFYVGDTNHLSHRLVRRGFSPSQAVLLILLLASACGALSFVL
jgi:UDP-GlcNAc:undecaprenyl-phosphate GlcNAc-1-phosphate transferase